MDSATGTNIVNIKQAIKLENHTLQNTQTDDTKLCIDVMFLISNNSSLRLNYNQFNEQAMEYLTHNVSRNPSDLQSHIQRIYMYMADFDGDRIYSALLDLFITLGNKGLQLRRRVLRESRHILKMQQYDALRDKLECGVNANDPMPLAPSSVLTKSYTGQPKLIERIAAEKPASPKFDPILEAGQYLEYGQIEEAKTLLEGAVLEEPWRKDLQDDLLEIYRVTLDGEACDTMYQKLTDSFIPDHHAWMQTAEQIQHSAGVV